MDTPGDTDRDEDVRSPRGHRGRRVRRAAVAVLGVAVLAGAGVVAVRESRDPVPAARPHPTTWSRAAEPYVAVVEQERGVAFVHPVRVDLMTPEDFARQVRADRVELRDAAAVGPAVASLTATLPVLRATGLVGADGVREGVLGEVAQEAPLETQGYYSYRDERIRIRGTQLTPATTVALLRALTHALQDQTLDTGAQLAQVDRDEGAAAGWHAVVDGDATRVEQAFRAGLPADEREALLVGDARRAQRGVGARLPEPVVSMLEAGPRLGAALVRLAARRGGPTAVDDLLTSPPRTDAELVDPVASRPGTGSSPGGPPAPPSAAGAVEVTTTGLTDALTWYAVLAQHLGLDRAMAAVDGVVPAGWSAYTLDGRDCTSMRAQAGRVAELDELDAAVRDWARARTGAPYVVERGAGMLTFSTCVPQGAETPPQGGAADRVGPALALAVARTGLVADGRVPDDRPTAARCYVDAAVASIKPEDLVARPRTARVERRLDAVAGRCLARAGSSPSGQPRGAPRG